MFWDWQVGRGVAGPPREDCERALPLGSPGVLGSDVKRKRQAAWVLGGTGAEQTRPRSFSVRVSLTPWRGPPRRPFCSAAGLTVQPPRHVTFPARPPQHRSSCCMMDPSTGDAGGPRPPPTNDLVIIQSHRVPNCPLSSVSV